MKISKFIHRLANDNVLMVDRQRLIEIVETEVLSLHEGNFARFKLRLSEYVAWKKTGTEMGMIVRSRCGIT